MVLNRSGAPSESTEPLVGGVATVSVLLGLIHQQRPLECVVIHHHPQPMELNSQAKVVLLLLLNQLLNQVLKLHRPLLPDLLQ